MRQKYSELLSLKHNALKETEKKIRKYNKNDWKLYMEFEIECNERKQQLITKIRKKTKREKHFSDSPASYD